MPIKPTGKTTTTGTARTARKAPAKAVAKAPARAKPAVAMAPGAAKPKPAAASARPKTATAPAKVPAAPRVEPKVVTSQTPVVAGPALTKKDLIDRAVDRSGIRKKFAKPAIESALAVLGEALAQGREVRLPPLGRGKVTRTEDKANVNIIVLKLRQSTADNASEADDKDDDDGDKTGLAPAAE